MAKKQRNENVDDEPHGIGHNGGPAASVDGVAGEMLNSIVERIERLEEDKKGIADDIKDVYAEAKGNGFDTKIIRKVVARRRIEKSKREEEDHLLDVYELSLENLNSMMEFEDE